MPFLSSIQTNQSAYGRVIPGSFKTRPSGDKISQADLVELSIPPDFRPLGEVKVTFFFRLDQPPSHRDFEWKSCEKPTRCHPDVNCWRLCGQVGHRRSRRSSFLRPLCVRPNSHLPFVAISISMAHSIRVRLAKKILLTRSNERCPVYPPSHRPLNGAVFKWKVLSNQIAAGPNWGGISSNHFNKDV